MRNALDLQRSFHKPRVREKTDEHSNAFVFCVISTGTVPDAPKNNRCTTGI
jgi:hypothetical protein